MFIKCVSKIINSYYEHLGTDIQIEQRTLNLFKKIKHRDNFSKNGTLYNLYIFAVNLNSKSLT